MNISSMSAYDVRHYSFRHVNYNVGLSSSNVKCITEDSYGFIWLGTKNGLHRFDGIGTRRLRCYDYEKMQGNDNINALYEDKYKNLWVGTDRGIYRYNPVTDRFSFMDAKDKRLANMPTTGYRLLLATAKVTYGLCFLMWECLDIIIMMFPITRYCQIMEVLRRSFHQTSV